nr:type IV conjugative transfer system coupling protein TraD [Yersinia frederiksenii]
MRHDEDRSYNKFLRTLLAIQLDQLRAFLAGTPASTLVDGKIEKTAISIRSVLTNYVKSLRYLQGIDRPGREKFTIREWMKGQTDKSKNGWLFITSDEQYHESLKPLISMWLSIAATSLLAMGRTGSAVSGSFMMSWLLCTNWPHCHVLSLKLASSVAALR